MVVVVACGQLLLFFVIIIAFIYRSPTRVIQLELCPFSLSHHALSPFLWTLSSFVWLGATVRQTDHASYTYISLHTRFVGFWGLLTTGRLQLLPLSLLLRCFSLFCFFTWCKEEKKNTEKKRHLLPSNIISTSRRWTRTSF